MKRWRSGGLASLVAGKDKEAAGCRSTRHRHTRPSMMPVNVFQCLAHIHRPLPKALPTALTSLLPTEAWRVHSCSTQWIDHMHRGQAPSTKHQAPSPPTPLAVTPSRCPGGPAPFLPPEPVGPKCCCHHGSRLPRSRTTGQESSGIGTTTCPRRAIGASAAGDPQRPPEEGSPSPDAPSVQSRVRL
jgi:hypothetical protein